MAEKPDNVVLTKAAAGALRREFVGWQCRLRQMAARESGGRPSSGMRPRVTTREGHEIAPGVVVLIVEAEPAVSTQLFRHQYLRTEDPNERYEKILEILQASYFQQPDLFSDVMTALFGAASPVAARLLKVMEAASWNSRAVCRVTGFPALSPGWPSAILSTRPPIGITACSIPIFRRASRSSPSPPTGPMRPIIGSSRRTSPQSRAEQVAPCQECC